ncbi:glycosyltransferase family 4 protein [Henriciella sp. AS95]|uniref:glycosyltransferase family 4 protein n=1 Tax=Henriciella sp. AS95 TaxID=3135782 RepID=UPI00317CE32A
MSSIQRIVVIHDSIEARGGATGLARLAAIQYRKLGLNVTFLTGAPDDGSLDEYGIETHGLGQNRQIDQSARAALLSGLDNAAARQFVSNWISQNDTPSTAYHLHNWSHILSPGVFSALKPVAARTVVSCHDFFNVCPNGGLLHFPSGQPCNLKPMSTACWLSQCDRRSSLHKYWRMARHTILLRKADFSSSAMTFVCLHEGMKTVMQQAGFDAPDFTSIPNPATAYLDEPVDAASNEGFLFIGRLTPEKGADIAAAAADAAGVKLTMIGEGPLADELKAKYPAIAFPGFCQREAIAAHVRQARALIVPGRWREPYGLVIAEAALSGLPVLLSEPSTLAPKIEQLGMGAVFDPARPTALVETLEKWASDDELVRASSENAFKHANSICTSPEGWAKQFLNLMQDKLNESNANSK